MGGCVVPVGPKFEDEPNYAPFIVDSAPGEGEIVAKDDDREAANEIRVTVADPNLNDTLYARWLIDYPKYDSSVSRRAEDVELPPVGSALRGEVRFSASCVDHAIVRGLAEHRVVLAVADRPFLEGSTRTLSDESRLDTPSQDGLRVRVVWLLKMECK